MTLPHAPSTHTASPAETRPALLWRGAHPALWLALFGILIAFAWEILQMPFYRTDDMAIYPVVIRCALASAGDGLLMVVAYLAASVGNSGAPWLVAFARWRLLLFLSVGIAVTVAIEHVALRSAWGWSYSSAMALIPGTTIGLVPVIMWIVVPFSALSLTRRLGTERC